MNKATEAFRTIGEVADELDVPKHVLRFWEGKFPQIRPMKRGGGRRYYRPEDMELLRGIRHLLHAEGYTIKGVQKILRTNGIDAVKTASAAAAATRADGKRRPRAAIASGAANSVAASGAKAAPGTLRSATDGAAAVDGTRSVPANTNSIAGGPALAGPPSASRARAKRGDGSGAQPQSIAALVRELEACRDLLKGCLSAASVPAAKASVSLGAPQRGVAADAGARRRSRADGAV
ncbi:MAG: MerR family transcriptional regulator [Hyphomicrobium sp.]